MKNFVKEVCKYLPKIALIILGFIAVGFYFHNARKDIDRRAKVVLTLINQFEETEKSDNIANLKVIFEILEHEVGTGPFAVRREDIGLTAASTEKERDWLEPYRQRVYSLNQWAVIQQELSTTTPSGE